MAWVYFTLLVVVDVGGLALAAFTLPGTWLMLAAAAAYAWATKGAYLGWYTLAALLGLTLAAEVLEFVFGGAGAKKAGASKWGILGGLVGAVLGGIFLTLIPVPILGTVAGICVGSFLGAFAVELLLGRTVGQSLRIGFGAFKGRLLGIVSKFTIALGMFALSVVAALGVGGWHKPAGTAKGPTTRTVPSTTISQSQAGR